MRSKEKLIEDYDKYLKTLIDSKFLQRLEKGEEFSYDAFYLGMCASAYLTIAPNTSGTQDFIATREKLKKERESPETRQYFHELLAIATRAKTIEITFK